MRVGEGWRGRREEGLSSFGELMWERGRANIKNDTTLSTIHVGLDFIQISSGVIVEISVLLSHVSWTFSQFFSRPATSYCNHASMTINRLWLEFFSFWTSMNTLDIRHYYDEGGGTGYEEDPMNPFRAITSWMPICSLEDTRHIPCKAWFLSVYTCCDDLSE